MLFSAILKQAATSTIKSSTGNPRLRLRKAALTLVIKREIKMFLLFFPN